MIDFKGAVLEVVDALTGAGIKATAEAADVRFPGVWVGGVSADQVTLGGEYEYTLDLYLVTKTTGELRSYAELDTLAGEVADVFPLADDLTLQVTSVSLPSAPAAPAYRYPITILR